MSASAVTPPPGFELERGEHLAVTPPPGFKLEDQSGQDSIQLPPGFELENQASKGSVQLSPGFELQNQARKDSIQLPAGFELEQQGQLSLFGSPKTRGAPTKFTPAGNALSVAAAGPKAGPKPRQPQPIANSVNVPGEQAPKPVQNIPGLPYPPLTPEQQAEIQRKNAAIRAREAEDNRLPDPTDDDLSTDPFQVRGPVRTKAQEREADTKSFVPDWAMPKLAWIQSHVNDPLDRMGQAGGKFVGDMLEGGAAAVLEGTGGYAEPGEAVDPESGLPLPRPEDYSPDKLERFRQDYPALSGTLRGVGGVVGATLADPRNWPFFFSGGLSVAARRAISAGFTVQVAKNAYDAADQVQRIWDDPNIPLNQKYEAITNSVLGALMAGASGSHTMGREGPPPLEPRLVEQLNRMGEEAKQQIYLRLQDKLLPRTQEIRAGDKVTLKDGSKATLAYVTPEMGRAVVRTRMGRAKTIPLHEIQTDRAAAVAIEFVLAESPHPRQKATPSIEQIYTTNASAPKQPVTKEGPRWDFQRKMCGDKEFLLKGGGEKVWADGPITSEGWLSTLSLSKSLQLALSYTIRG